jgi:hypothetical protein
MRHDKMITKIGVHFLAMDQPAVLELVSHVVRDYLLSVDPNDGGGAAKNADVSHATVLSGPSAVVDSAGLVSVILEVETRVREACGKDVMLANDRAFSQSQSPFRDVQSLSAYVTDLLND